MDEYVAFLVVVDLNAFAVEDFVDCCCCFAKHIFPSRRTSSLRGNGAVPRSVG